jgi:hypothetical protein
MLVFSVREVNNACQQISVLQLFEERPRVLDVPIIPATKKSKSLGAPYACPSA